MRQGRACTVGESRFEGGEVRVVVTGATGFVGRHLTEALLERGWRITVAVRRPQRLGALANALTVILWDASGPVPEALRQAIHQADCLFHIAGLIKTRNAAQFYRINTAATVRLYDACRGSKCRFLFVSSQAAAGSAPRPIPLSESSHPHPRCHYGLSKLKAESYIRSTAHTAFVIARPSLVFGPGDPETTQLVRLVRSGFIPAVPAHLRLLSVVYIYDLVDALILLATHPDSVGKVFFVTHPQPVSMVGFLKEMAQVLGKCARRLNLPCSFMELAALGGDIFGRLTKTTPSINSYKLPHILARWWLCSPRRLMEIGWRPRFSLKDALADWLTPSG